MKHIKSNVLILIRRIIYSLLPIFDNLVGQKQKIIVFCYHSISEDNWRFGVAFSELKKQVQYLLLNFDSISLKDLDLYLKGKKVINNPSFVITFDDGYKDILKTKTYFKKLGIKPGLFVLSDSIHANFQELGTKRKFLTERNIKNLKNSGWEIGSHSATHSDLTTLDKQTLLDEIKISKKELEKKLGFKINYFAYPKGRYSLKVLKVVRESGFNLGLSMDDGVINKGINKLVIPRIGVDRTHNFSEFKNIFSPAVVLVRGFIKNNIGANLI